MKMKPSGSSWSRLRVMRDQVDRLFSSDYLLWRANWTGALVALILTFAAAPAAAETETETKSVFMILWRGETRVEQGVRAYFEEHNLDVALTIRSLDRDITQIDAALAEVEAADPDLVYVWGTSITLATAGRAPALAEGPEDYPPRIVNRPVVFTMVSQPVRSRIIADFGPTGRNVTGVSHIVPLETQFQAMTAYMPVDRLAVIYTPTEPNSVLNVEALKALGEREGVMIDAYPAPLDAAGEPLPASLPGLVAKAAAQGPQFLYMGPDSFIGEYAAMVTEAANSVGMATFTATERMLLSGGALYGLVASYDQVGRLTARKVEQILFNGADPGAEPVEVLPRFSYQIRIDTARALGLPPAMSLMGYAEFIGG